MSGRRHPTDETLAALAAGAMGPGPMLVVETHVHGCPECRRKMRAFEAIGGALLDEVEPTVLPNDLLARTWALIEARGESRQPLSTAWHEPFPGAPSTLRDCEIGPWRFIQPGLRIAMVTPRGEVEASAMLMRVSAGRQMPSHTHDGVEYTQVLSGAYSDASGRFVAGDYDEANGEVSHQPHADPGQDCICLAAIEGRLRLTSFVGRLAQSMLGF
jgi:putative transcriptional regulator